MYVGTTANPGHSSGPARESSPIRLARSSAGKDGCDREIDSIIALGLPPRGAKYELESLRFQAERFVEPRCREETRLEESFQEAIKGYPVTQVPEWLERGLRREDVEKVMKTQKRDSGPGLPWTLLGRSKGEVIDQHGDLVVDATMELIEKLSTTKVGELPSDPVELIKQGWVTPLKVFVKNEPHSKEKLDTGRLRIIVAVPLHVVLAETLVFGVQNGVEINHWDQIPSAPGIGLAIDEHLEIMWKRTENKLKNGELAEADISGFDFSLTEKMFELDGRRRIIAAGAEDNVKFTNLVQNLHHIMTHNVFTTSDGKMYAQIHGGIMKSGRYVTSSTNSFIRVLLACAAGSRETIAMGDDSLETYDAEAVKRYEKLGLKVKFYKRCSDTFEFCSHTFANGRAWPSNPGKMAFNLLNQRGKNHQERVTLFQQWAFEMRYHPEFDRWVKIIERLGWWTQINTKDGQESSTETATVEEN